MEGFLIELCIELFLRGVALCLLTAMALVLLRRSAAAYRHLLCVLALFGLLVLPFAQRLLPPLRLLPPQSASAPELATVPAQDAGDLSGLNSKSERGSSPDRTQEPIHGAKPATLVRAGSGPATEHLAALPLSPHQEHTRKATAILFAIWGLGTATLLIRLMAALFRLRTLEAESRNAMLGSVPIRISEQVKTPLTWGVRRSVILLPVALLSGDRAVCGSALRHEQAHIARWDWVWNLFAEVVCAFCWFQPSAWWLRRRMRLESERACDDRVLLSGIAGPDYAAHLLQILRAVGTSEVAPAMAQSGEMEERMRHILDTKKPRRAKQTWLAVSALFALALLSLAALRVAAKPTEANRDRTLTGHSKSVNAVVFSPDSKHLVTASADGTAIVWDVTTGQSLLTLKGGTAAISSALYTPDGKLLITGCSDGAIHIWDAATGEKLRSLAGPGGGVRALDISSDGANLLGGYENGTVKLWNTSTGQDGVTFPYANRLLSAAISPDGNSIAAGYLDATLKVWDIQTRQSLLSRKISASKGFTGMHFDRNNTLYTWDREESKDGKSKITAMTAWSIEAMKKGGAVILGIITFPGTENAISHVVSYDTFIMLFGQSGGQAVLNNMHDGPVTLDAHEGPVAALAISPDGTWGATGGKRDGKGEAKIWVIKAHRPAKPAEAKLQTLKGTTTMKPDVSPFRQSNSADPADKPAPPDGAVATQADVRPTIDLKNVVWGKALDGLKPGILLTTPGLPNNRRVPFNSNVGYEVLVRNTTRRDRVIEVQCQDFNEMDPYLIPDGDIRKALGGTKIPDNYRARGVYDERIVFLGYAVKLAPGEAVVVPDGDIRNVSWLYVGNVEKERFPRIEEVTTGVNWLLQPITVRSLTPAEAVEEETSEHKVNLTIVNRDGKSSMRGATRLSISPGEKTLYAKIQIDISSS